MQLKSKVIAEGKKVIAKEIEQLQNIHDALADEFFELVSIIHSCKGKVILTGVGKSGHVAKKISATLSSLGTASFYVHSAEALHGDLGVISKHDVVVMFSNSGETIELLHMIPSLRAIGATIVSLVGNENSKIYDMSDYSVVIGVTEEACSMNIAPTSSTTVQMVYGDAIAIVLSQIKEFNKENFATFHPLGSIGRTLLLRVKDIMMKKNYYIYSKDLVKDAIMLMSTEGLNGVTVVDKDHNLLGVFTDGDLRRLLEQNSKDFNVFEYKMLDVLSRNPLVTYEQELAASALKMMKSRKEPVIFLPVVDENNQLSGIIRIHDILREGVLL